MNAPSKEVPGSAMERTILGVPAAEALVLEAERKGAKRVFVMASGHLSSSTDEILRIEQALGGRHAVSFQGIRSHGPMSDTVRATCAARDAGADLIVAVGGGSVIDAAKVVGLALRHEVASVEQLRALRIGYKEGQITKAPDDGPSVRAVCVPTTLSGGEFNSLSGALDEEAGQKLGFQHPLMAPMSVVLDPAITRHTPDWLWFSTGIRAVDHAVETLVSVYSNPYYDGVAESGLRLLAQALPRSFARKDDFGARLDCQVGAWQSIIPLVGGVPMGASHAIGHALGAHCGVPHGYTSCVMAPWVQLWNGRIDIPRQKRVAAAMGSADRPLHEALAELIGSLRLPQDLGAIGVQERDFPQIAKLTLEDLWGDTNIRPLKGADDVIEIMHLAQDRENSRMSAA